MKLKQEIQDVLDALGATPDEIEALVGYFADKLTQANASVTQIGENIASLEKQLVEETERGAKIRAGVMRFVDMETDA